MLGSFVLWLVVGNALEISAFFEDDDSSSISVEGAKEMTGHLNIQQSLFDYYLSGQFYSMGTDTDLLPWDTEDEFIYRNNHEIAMAFLKLWTKLFAIEEMTNILKDGIASVHKKRSAIGVYESAITALCDYLEQRVNGESSLFLVYRKIKHGIIAAQGNKKFARKTWFQTLSNNSDTNFRRIVAFMDTNQEMRALNVNWMFYHRALVVSNATKRNNFIVGQSVVAVSKSGILQEKLQNIYDHARFKVAKLVKYHPYSKNRELRANKIVTSLVGELEMQISRDNILSKAFEEVKETVTSSVQLKNFKFKDY